MMYYWQFVAGEFEVRSLSQKNLEIKQRVYPWLFYSNVWQNSLQIKKKKESKVKVYLNKNRLSEGDWADLLGAAALGLFSKMVFLVVSRSVVSDSLWPHGL